MHACTQYMHTAHTHTHSTHTHTAHTHTHTAHTHTHSTHTHTHEHTHTVTYWFQCIIHILVSTRLPLVLFGAVDITFHSYATQCAGKSPLLTSVGTYSPNSISEYSSPERTICIAWINSYYKGNLFLQTKNKGKFSQYFIIHTISYCGAERTGSSYSEGTHVRTPQTPSAVNCGSSVSEVCFSFVTKLPPVLVIKEKKLIDIKQFRGQVC